jgi:hypothetical protein
MIHPFRVAIDAFRWLLLIIFGVLTGFWSIVLVSTVGEFIRGGSSAVQQWYLKVMLGPEEILAQRGPRWGIVELRIGAIAVLTILLWLANRRAIRRLVTRRRR